MSDSPSISVRTLKSLFGSGDLLLTAGLFGTIVLLILPLPPAGMDFLLAGSIGISLLILLVIISVKANGSYAS